MLDNQLIALVIATAIAQEEIAGIENTPIKQAFQPTNQGVNAAPTAYMYKVGDRRVGSPHRSEVWDQEEQKEIHTEMQQYATTFQIAALSTQDPTNTAQYTASDILNLMAYILQSDRTIAALQAQGVGLERVTEVRNTPFQDDRQRWEYHPSFDFTLTHKQSVTNEIPVLQSTEFQIISV